MPKMTKEGEAKLRDALDSIVDLVNAGTDPDDAIVKVASQRAIPPGHIGLMVAATIRAALRITVRPIHRYWIKPLTSLSLARRQFSSGCIRPRSS
jgi:hypothetical protein